MDLVIFGGFLKGEDVNSLNLLLYSIFEEVLFCVINS